MRQDQLNSTDPLTGPIGKTFLKYAIPSVLGMVALSSATLVDGVFLGNFVGASALAAANITFPVASLLYAVSLMLAVGGSVICGKLLGEKKPQQASAVFTAIMAACLLVSLLICMIGVVFVEPLVLLLGANAELAPLAISYLQIIVLFAPFLMAGFALTYFVRVDGYPVLASIALAASAVTNIALDWLFIIEFKWGIEGAAYATGISEAAIVLFLIPYFFSKRRSLHFNFKSANVTYVVKAMANGISEFANELSAGVITLLFNWIMISSMGVAGVAAYTVVNYLLFCGLMICYGVSESLQPLISQNLGARNGERIKSYLNVGLFSVTLTGVVIIALLLLIPDLLIGLFLNQEAAIVGDIATQFLSLFWPTFLFCGVNIALSSYFTAMHKPMHSAVIALSRSLVLPGILLLILPKFMGSNGVYISIPVAEALTFVLAWGLYQRNKPVFNSLRAADK